MTILFRWVSVVLICLLALSAQAQDVDLDEFDRFAASVENSIAEGNLTDQGFETLRDRLVEWRDALLSARDVNSVEIDALEAQLDALGPAPAEGETEPDGIASRRAELRSALEEARAPQIAAVESHARADALIGRIDATIRERQTDQLFELQRSPLDPTVWPGALAAAVGVVTDIRSEVASAFDGEAYTELWQRGLLAAILLILAVLLITRVPPVVERLLRRVETGTGTNGIVVYGFLISFASVLSTVLGISLINAALISTGILGDAGRATAIGINAAILAYAVARWLAGRIFPESEMVPSTLRLDARLRSRGRKNAGLLGMLAGFVVLIVVLNQSLGFDAEALSVVALPIFIALGLVLFRIGHLIWRGSAVDEDEAAKFSDRIAQIIGRAVQVIAVAAPLLAAIGFFNLARGILVPTVLSLGLIAFLLALHYFLRAAYAMARGLNEEEARLALTPVLASLLVTIAAIPIFALIWGARNSDLGEVWESFRAGIKIGDATISPVDFLTFGIVFAIGYGLTRLVQGTLRASVLPRTRIDKGGQTAIVSGLGYAGITLAAIIGITSAGIDLSSLALVVGALGVGIGFGLQNIVNNFVSGIILLVERPVSEGDIVEVGGKLGTVQSISVRSTRIETFDRQDVIVPNGDFISGTVTNWTRGNSYTRVTLNVGVAYGTDTHLVHDILTDICEAHPLVAANPPPAVYFTGFGADALDFTCYCILRDVNFKLQVHSDLNHEVHRRFREEGIEIPFAQRDVWLRNPDALSDKAGATPPATSTPPSARPSPQPEWEEGGGED